MIPNFNLNPFEKNILAYYQCVKVHKKRKEFQRKSYFSGRFYYTTQKISMLVGYKDQTQKESVLLVISQFFQIIFFFYMVHIFFSLIHVSTAMSKQLQHFTHRNGIPLVGSWPSGHLITSYKIQPEVKI